VVLRREQGTDFSEQVTASGVVRAWVLARNVYVTQASGHMHDDHCAFLEAFGEEQIRCADGAKHYIFHEWMELTGYESRTRVRLTTWSAARRHTFQEVHLAIKSRMVAMGVQVANIALGGFMRAHTGISSLEVELARVMRQIGTPERASRMPGR
jgi:hypothetical protein